MAHGNENSRSLKLGDKGAVSFKLKLCIGFIFGIRLCEMAEYSLYANIFERGYFLDLFNALVGIGIAYAPIPVSSAMWRGAIFPAARAQRSKASASDVWKTAGRISYLTSTGKSSG